MLLLPSADFFFSKLIFSKNSFFQEDSQSVKHTECNRVKREKNPDGCLLDPVCLSDQIR